MANVLTIFFDNLKCTENADHIHDNVKSIATVAK